MVDLAPNDRVGSAFLVTSVTYRRTRWFANDSFASILTEQIVHYAQVHDYFPLAYCVMPDHYHLVILTQGFSSLSQILHSIHSFSTTMITRELSLERKPKVWQGRAWNRPLRTREALTKAIAYTLLDPWRSGLVENPTDPFPHSNLGDMLETHGKDYVLELFEHYASTKE